MRKKKGVTLIELIAVMAIMSIIGVTLSTVFTSTLNLNKRQSTKLQLQQDAEKLDRSITADIRRAVVEDSPIIEFKIYNPALNPDNKSDFVADMNSKNNAALNYIPKFKMQSVRSTRIYYAVEGNNMRRIELSLDASGKVSSLISDKIVAGDINSFTIEKNPSNPKCYDILADFGKDGQTNSTKFRVSLIDYGGVVN